MALAKTYFSLDLEHTHGDPLIIPLVFEDSDGNPIDISGWEFYYTIKAALTDADSAAVAKLRPGDAGIVTSEYPTGLGTTNRVDLVLEPSALTGLTVGEEYYHDIQVVPDDGRTYTYAKGILQETYQVTEDSP
jgi:hypothetical protein